MRETASAPDDAKRVTMQVSTVGIVCNAALTVFKLVAGIVAHSSAIVADAVHSASDILGSLIVMIGAIFSNKAADASHPYGHEKLECIASILLGNILVLVGAAIGYTGITKILHGETLAAPGMLALIAAVVSIVVKEALYWYTIAAAKRIRSVSLKAEAWHHRSDALSSIGSFAGVLGARLGLPILDPIASIVICLFIFKVAFGIFRESIDRLVDRAADTDTVAAMRRTMLRTPGVVRVDDLKTRLFGSRTYVDGRDIHLLPRAAVYGDEIRTVGLDLLCNLHAGQVVGVPADAHLDGQRGILAQRPAGGGNHLPAERRVQQQPAARAAAGDLGRRAAHIDVEHIKPDALFPDKEYRLFQCFRLCAEKLDGIQAVGVLVLQKLQRFAVAEVQRLGACHLADGPGRAVVGHQMAARRVGQPRHRRKHRPGGGL